MKLYETVEASAVVAVIIYSLFFIGSVVVTFADLVPTGSGLAATLIFAVLLAVHVAVLVIVRRFR